ncbi:MAG: hypothetical protein PHS04_02690 [Tissierellia bacterium]|nr:hypothetical protein [Tissierellia bacterium]
MGTKNIGQVSGVHIGSTPPVNIIMIWYDNTPSQKVHKVYDVNLSQWVVLDKNTISTITYSELVNLATSVGLSVGAWFKISDRSNALALAVTTTKVQYSDSLGNVLIDDLGTNVQYHVTSSNLSIDDVVGVFDNVNKKLVFQFNEQVPDYTADDFILGKVKRNNVWSLAKYKLSSFLSKVTGNSISWNGGFFFNFNNAVSNILDKTGGVVSKETYDEEMHNVNTAINNVGQENQTIIQNANQAITIATQPTAIYEKALPSDLEVGGAATNISKGDTLYTLISKIQRWINQFKFATGINISKNFKDGTTPEHINNNDTVESAFQKVQYWLKYLKDKTQTNVATFDYVVDSNDSLKALKNNTSAKNVLIKKGTWIYETSGLERSDSMLLLNENIKLVYAEPGSLIKFTGNADMISGSSLDYNLIYFSEKRTDVKFENVSVLIDFTTSSWNNFITCFKNISNMNNCSVSNTDSLGGNKVLMGFNNCDYLNECKFTGWADSGFKDCTFLNKCFAKNSNVSKPLNKGFQNCEYLTNCEHYLNISKGSGGLGYLSSYYYCNNLNFCDSLIQSDGDVRAYFNCVNCVGCNSKVNYDNDNPDNTVNCYSGSRFINCSAEITKIGSGAVRGFAASTKVLNCSVKGFTETVDDKKYQAAYASSINDDTYSCSDTPNGGFNS